MQKALDLFNQHKNKLILAKISSLQVVVSFISSLIVLNKIGLGAELDVYYISLAIFTFLSTSINWSIASVLPTYLINNRGKEIEGSLFITTILLTLPVGLIALLSTPLWIDLIFINYTNTVSYGKIFNIQLLLLIAYTIDSLILIFNAIMQERDKYIHFNTSLFLSSFISLLFIYLTIEDLGIYAAVAGQIIMKLTIFIFGSVLYGKIVFKNLKIDYKQLQTIFGRIKYLIMGSLYFRTEETAERFIASYLSEGFVSLVSFIQKIYGAIITVVNSIIGVPAITTFGNLIQKGQYGETFSRIKVSLSALMLIHTISFILIGLIGEKAIMAILQDDLAKELNNILPIALICLYFNVVGKTISQVLQSALMALNKVQLATVTDSITYTINILIKIALTVNFGMQGFIIAIALGAIVTDTAKLFFTCKTLKKLM